MALPATGGRKSRSVTVVRTFANDMAFDGL